MRSKTFYRSARKYLMQECVRVFQSVDVLINNAACVRDKPLHALTGDDWDQVVNSVTGWRNSVETEACGASGMSRTALVRRDRKYKGEASKCPSVSPSVFFSMCKQGVTA